MRIDNTDTRELRRKSMPLMVVLGLATLLAACQPEPDAQAVSAPPLVRVAEVVASGIGAQGLSGTVRARVEAPLAFQVGGRITHRSADAGQTVRAGQTLMRLDPSDLDQAVQAAQAEHAAALAALATAEADLARTRRLAAQGFVSEQAVERAELQRREVLTRRDAAAAQLSQTRNARGYAVLAAPAPGVLIEVSAEPGQVVAAGQSLAVLAHGAREIEVFFPDSMPPPAAGQVLTPDGRTLDLALREVAGAVEPVGRTRRARYTVNAGGEALVLGSVVSARFNLTAAVTPDDSAFAIPVAALDERGRGARVWRVRDGRVEPVSVQVLMLDETRAQVRGPLAPNDRIVALGTHLLQPGMAVRELAR